MAHFEWRMVQPAHHEVIAALQAAQAQANEVIQVNNWDFHGWDAYVASIQQVPEGQKQWARSLLPVAGSGVMGVAWWTDHASRRHFRVYGGSSSDGSYQRVHVAKPAMRPPLWHIAPMRTFRRTRDDETSWLVLCPCGRCGAPGALGWMGTCCSYCHDREVHEQVPVSTAEQAPTFEVGGKVLRLAFSPDAQRLAVATPGGLDLIQLPSRRQRRIMYEWRNDEPVVGFMQATNQLVVVGVDNKVFFIDLETLRGVYSLPAPMPVRHLAIASDGLTLAMANARGVEIWGRGSLAASWVSLASQNLQAQGVAFSPDGEYLVIRLYSDLRICRIIERGGRVLPSPQRGSETYQGVGFPNQEALLALRQPLSGTNPAGEEDADTRPLHRLSLDGGPLPTFGFHSTSRDWTHLSADGRWLLNLTPLFLELQEISHRRLTVNIEETITPHMHKFALADDASVLAWADKGTTVRVLPLKTLIEA